MCRYAQRGAGKKFKKMYEEGRGTSRALLRTRLRPAISIIQHDERSLGGIAWKDGYELTGSSSSFKWMFRDPF